MLCRNVFGSFLKFKTLRLRQCARAHSVMKKILEPITDQNKYRILEDLITPLAPLPYEKQLYIKNITVRDHVKLLIDKGVKQVNVLPLIPSPIFDHYRSKDEFNVQFGLDGNPKTFGFYTGNFNEEKVFAVSPTYLRNVKPEHKRVLQVFEEFVRKSPLPPCYRLNDGGYWRQILIRSNLRSEIMVVVVVHPQNRLPEEIAEEQQQLIQHFVDNNIQLHSLYYNLSKHVKGTEENSKFILLHGEPYLYEEFLQHQFQISPTSFFQINVKAAEVLHKELLQLTNFKSTHSLLDLCCGVGTFSISYAEYVRNCIGIEQNLSSVENALANCSLNNINNCVFTPGKLEERLRSVYEQLENVHDLVVILNPGRSGVHPRVIHMLRNFPMINQIFYISCKPDNIFTIKNVKSLLNVKNKKTKPFVLSTVKSVDLFPHTMHYEMIMHFER